MSANGTLRIELRRSLQLAGILLFAHVLALASAWISLAGWPLFLVGGGILVSAASRFTAAIHRSRGAVTALELHAEGRADWRDREGDWHEGRLRRAHFVSAVLIVIGLDQSERSRRWIVLLPDSAPADELRRLRVWLRWGTPGPGKDANRGAATE